MEDDLQKNWRQPLKNGRWTQKKTISKKLENKGNLKKNKKWRRPQKKSKMKTTSKKIKNEDDLKKNQKWRRPK